MTQINTFLASEADTLALGAKLAQTCQAPCVIFLSGELGAGKTTLVRGFLEALGYVGRVKSPTYTLVEPYIFPMGTVYHFDLYRLQTPEELEYCGARDYFDDRAICLIEWPEQGAGFLSKANLSVKIDFDTQNQMTGRRVTITK